MVTRREARAEELARLAAEGGDTRTQDPQPASSAEDGDLVGLLLRTGAEEQAGVADDAIPTRVKVPSDKADKPKRGRPAGRTATERELASVGENLEEKIAVIFGLAAGIAPVTSTYAVENSPKAIHALLEIAKRRPAVLRALTQVADGANALEIGKFLLGVLVCIQVDTGRLQGDEIQARAFGVTDILQRHFVDSEGKIPTVVENPNVMEQVVPGALRFQPI